MQNLKRKIRKINQNKYNKRHLRADVLSLLSSALRPRLLSAQKSVKCDKKELNRGGFSLNIAKIVVMTTILSVFGLFSMNFATPVSAVSLTLTVPSDPLALELQPNSTFTKSSSNSVSVKTDAFAGYSLSIKAKNNNELVNEESKLTSISQNLSEEQYQGEGNINTWGYQPNKFNGLDNTLFLPGPTTDPSIIESTKTANSDATNTYEFTLGAKADATINQGAYQNTFVFSATANTVSYKITYELNSGSWNGTSPQTGSTAESTITLDTNTPTKSGYEFKGWCPQQTSNETCGTTSYQPGNSYPLQNNDNDVILWAMWKAAAITYSITYNTMGGSQGPSPSTQTGQTTSSYVSISEARPFKGHTYVFSSWCTTQPSGTSCSGQKYYSGGSYNLSSGSHTVTLYAVYDGPYTSLANAPRSGCSSPATYAYNNLRWSLDFMWKNMSGQCFYQSSGGYTMTWDEAQTICPSGFRLISQSDLTLIPSYGYTASMQSWTTLSSGNQGQYCYGGGASKTYGCNYKNKDQKYAVICR